MIYSFDNPQILYIAFKIVEIFSRIVLIAGLGITAFFGCWLWKRRHANNSDDYTPSDMVSTGSCYFPPHYSRCNSFVQTLPPPYNEVTHIFHMQNNPLSL